MALSAPATPTPAQAPADLTSTRVASPLLLNRSSPSGGQLQPLAPTYIGCLESNEDVLFLLQGCFSGILKHSIPGTRGVTSACRSGCIFIWEEKISGIEYWNDGLSWTSVVRDGHFWIRRETTTDCELERKTISILAQGRLHHVESYEDPWDMTLQRPSQDSRLRDMTLNKELTSQRKGQYALSRDTQCLRVILKTCSRTGQLLFMRSALILFRSCANDVLFEQLLRRGPGHWYPRIPSSREHWFELCGKGLFRGMSPQELKTQSNLLLRRMIDFSNGVTPSRLLRDQPSGKFSAVQNRSLLGEPFRVPLDTTVSLRSLDLTKLSIDLARSTLFHRSPQMDPADLKKWIDGLTQHLPVDPPAHGLPYPFLDILEQMPLEECEKVHMMEYGRALPRFLLLTMNSIHYCRWFPSFMRKTNRLPLFLVLCRSIPMSTRSTELLRRWARSSDGLSTYHVLLATHRDALPPDELMLSLSALASLHTLSSSTEPDGTAPSEEVQLIDVDRLVNGYVDIHDSQAVLREMVWSFFRALVHALPSEHALYVQFFDSTLAAVGFSEGNPERILDHFWMKRLCPSPVGHVAAVAKVWDDAQSLPAPTRAHVRYTDIVQSRDTKDDGEPVITTSCRSTSTGVGDVTLVKHAKDEHGVNSQGNCTSLAWWNRLLGGLGFHSCGERCR